MSNCILFLLYFSSLLNINSLSSAAARCNYELSSCEPNSHKTTAMQAETSTVVIDTKIQEPRQVSQPQRSRKRNSSHKNSHKRKTIRRKIHRHSTRVLTLKPAVILLPPFENNINGRNISTLNPFIINSILNGNTSTINTTIFEEVAFTINESNLLTPPTPIEFLLPPLPDLTNNALFVEQVERPLNLSHKTKPGLFQSSFYFENTNNFEKSVKSLITDFQSTVNTTELNSQLELSTETFVTEQEGPIVLQPYLNQTDTEYGNYYSESFLEMNPYNTTTEKSFAQQQIDVSFYNFNNTLLAPDVASSGMKIVTSKKGLEMMEELKLINESEAPDGIVKAGDHLSLDTAETGDIRLQSYKDQIITLEDVKDIARESSRTYKRPYKPFDICKSSAGYVADISSGCQLFYICLGRGSGEPMMCPNGTLFNQDFLVCDWWYNVECNG